MEKDKLEVGMEYWLDEDKNDSGVYKGASDDSVLFERVTGSYYDENEDGFVDFELSDDEFYLVSKNPVN